MSVLAVGKTSPTLYQRWQALRPPGRLLVFPVIVTERLALASVSVLVALFSVGAIHSQDRSEIRREVAISRNLQNGEGFESVDLGACKATWNLCWQEQTANAAAVDRLQQTQLFPEGQLATIRLVILNHFGEASASQQPDSASRFVSAGRGNRVIEKIDRRVG